MPFVSVVINVRNGAETLGEAIRSVLNQTFQDWELVIWDDFSSDASMRVAIEYKDPRVRVCSAIRHTNLGRARHDAVSVTLGEWIAFLDQDDVWLERKLEQQVGLCEPGVGLIYGRTVIFNESGLKHDFDHLHEYSPLPEGDIFVRLFTDSCFIAMSSAMLLRAAVVSLGDVPEMIATSPDYHYFVAIAHTHHARAVQNVVCLYRRHSNNMSSRYTAVSQAEAIWIVEQWAHLLSPSLVKRRSTIHHTVIAVYYGRRLRTFFTGFRILLVKGSITFLASKPFVLAWRHLRRRLYIPEWRRVL